MSSFLVLPQFKKRFESKYKFAFIFLFLMNSTVIAQQKNDDVAKLVYGVITNDNKPLSGVIITDIVGQKQVLSGKDGKYKIRTATGSTLRYRYTGLQTVDIIVEDVTSELNLKMTAFINRLDEVVVTSENLKSKKKVTDLKSNKIENAYGKIDTRAAGYGVNFVDGKELSEVNIDLARALIGKIPGYRLSTDNDGREVAFLKPQNSITQSTFAIWDVDGMILENPPFIPIQDVAYVAAIKSLAGTVRYGSIGSGGVIIVKTKRIPGLKGIDTKYLNDKFYQNDAVRDPDALTATKEYFKKIKNVSTIAELNSYFKDEKKSYENDPWFYIAAYGQYLMAWRTYMSYLYNGNTLGETGIAKIMHREMQALFYLHQSTINTKEQFSLPKNLKDISNDVRLVFEWSSGEAEFDLEFVSHDKRSYVWNHEYLPNKEQILEEKQLGYSSKEFVIEKLNKDNDWLINLTYYGNKTNKPCLLKMSVFHNWGTKNQKETIQTYLLDKENVKVNLTGFVKTSKENLRKS